LDPSIDRANERTGKWAEDEDSKLKDAVQMHGGKDWAAIAPLVPGRTRNQCRDRWKGTLDPIIGETRRTGKWTPDEDDKLKDAVQTHGDKDWAAIAALVPCRAEKQCWSRWNVVLDPSIDRMNERTGKWAEGEDIKLKDSVQLHGGKDWAAIAALVSGRTKIQCNNRWKSTLDPSIDLANERTGKWDEDEDIKLKDAVQMHGGKDWAAIAALVPGRTRNQCRDRWKGTLDPIIGGMTRRTGKWTLDEDNKLKDAVQTHGDKDWTAIAALVPGRTKIQCNNRWKDALDPRIDRASGNTDKWADNEDTKLKDAVKLHGGKDWVAISALVPGRARKQCWSRWHYVLNYGIDRANECTANGQKTKTVS
jgi:phosphoribosylanthranilate isomerase